MRLILDALILAGVVLVGGVGLYELHAVHDDLQSVRHTLTSTRGADQSGTSQEVRALRRQVQRLTHQLTALQKRSAGRRRFPVRGVRHASVLATVIGFNYAFRPNRLSVRVGTTVTWVNKTSSPHTVTSLRGLFNRYLPAYRGVTLLFGRPGTYRYHCRFHPYQRGTIVVLP